MLLTSAKKGKGSDHDHNASLINGEKSGIARSNSRETEGRGPREPAVRKTILCMRSR